MSGFLAIDADGRRRPLKARSLELTLRDGRCLQLSLGEGADELRLAAEVDGGVAVMLVQPVSANMLAVRVAGPASAQTERRPRLALSVQKAVRKRDGAGLPRRRDIRQWASAALACDAEITVRIVDSVEGQALNKAYRGKDYATNVLTFVYHEGDENPRADDAPLAGDLVLCAPVVAAEALAQGKSLLAHYAHLVVHGVLHLQGYDHENDEDAERMESREREILANLGYSDPYVGEQQT